MEDAQSMSLDGIPQLSIGGASEPVDAALGETDSLPLPSLSYTL